MYSFLDNAPNYLVGCVIQKRRKKVYYLIKWKTKSEFNPTVAALGHEKDVEQDWIEVKIGDTIYLE